MKAPIEIVPDRFSRPSLGASTTRYVDDTLPVDPANCCVMCATAVPECRHRNFVPGAVVDVVVVCPVCERWIHRPAIDSGVGGEFCGHCGVAFASTGSKS